MQQISVEASQEIGYSYSGVAILTTTLASTGATSTTTTTTIATTILITKR
jgi:hypothetical protein